MTTFVNGEGSLSIAVEINQESFTGADIAFTFDPTVVEIKSIDKGDLFSNWMLAANTEIKDSVQVGLAGDAPVNQSGELLKIHFKVIGDNESMTALTFTKGKLDEGRIATTLFKGSLNVKDGIMGDINADQVLDLKDLVLAFKLMAGMDLNDTLLSTAAEINGDNKIGMKDMVYILKEIVRE